MKFKKLNVAVLVLAMMLNVIVFIPVNAAGSGSSNTTLEIENSYITATQTQKPTYQKNTGTYSGLITINAPLAKVIEPLASYMKQYPNNYPWSATEKGQTASIKLNVTFPANADVSAIDINNINIDNKVSFLSNFSNATRSKNIVYNASTKTLEFNLPLTQVNWGQMYTLYEEDMNNLSAHMLNITIPYTVVANNRQEALNDDYAKIVANGSFAFSPSGGFFWGWFNQSYNTNTVQVPLTIGFENVFPQTNPTVTKPNVKPVAQPAAKPNVKPVIKPAAKPVAQPLSVKPVNKTQTSPNTVNPPAPTGKTNNESNTVNPPAPTGKTNPVPNTVNSPVPGGQTDNNKQSKTSKTESTQGKTDQQSKTNSNQNQSVTQPSQPKEEDIINSQVEDKFDEGKSITINSENEAFDFIVSLDFSKLNNSGNKVPQTAIKAKTVNLNEVATNSSNNTITVKVKAPVGIALSAQDSVKLSGNASKYFTVSGTSLSNNVLTINFKSVDSSNTIDQLLKNLNGNNNLDVIISNSSVDSKFIANSTESVVTSAYLNLNGTTDLGTDTLFIKYLPPIKENVPVNLNADILINADNNLSTEHSAIYDINGKDTQFDLIGTLDVSTVKQQMAEIENAHKSVNYKQITLSNIESTFTAELTVPKEMNFSSNTPVVTLNQGSTEIYKIINDKIKVVTNTDGTKTLTVPMTLKDNPTNYNKLHELIQNSMPDKLELTVSQNTLANNVEQNTNYTVTGKFVGNFKATAKNTESGSVIDYNFIWNGVQSTDGSDYIQRYSKVKNLQLTYNYKALDKEKLNADIFVKASNGNLSTEHKAIYDIVGKNTSFDLIGTLDASEVKNQMIQIEEKYKNTPIGSINLSDVNASFIAKLTVPKEINFASDKPEAVLDENSAKAYMVQNNKITVVNNIDGSKTLIVPMTLKDKDLTKYSSLQDTIKNIMPDTITLTVKGNTFNDNVLENTNYTVKGAFSGDFSANAKNSASQNILTFNFNWTGVQSADGSDYIQRNSSVKNLQLTVNYVSDKNSTNNTSGDKNTVNNNNNNAVNSPEINPENNPVSSKLNTKDHYAYMFGYKDGTFRPDRQMTRAETAVMFARLMNYKTAETEVFPVTYNDVNKTDWYFRAIEFMTENGIVKGYPDGNFRPNGYITRAEFAAMASRFDNIVAYNGTTFSDIPQGYWATKYINSAVAQGWIKGYPDGMFLPDRDITRAEVVTVTNRMLYRQADKAFVENNRGKLKEFKDLKESYWAYYHIMEATNAHEFHRAGKGIAEIWEQVNNKAFDFAVVGKNIK